MDHFFNQESSIGVLFIGACAEDFELFEEAKKRFKHSYREVCQKGAVENFQKNKPKVVVANYTFGDINYGEALESIKALDENVELIMLISDKDCPNMIKLLDLKASRYLHEKACKDEVLKNVAILVRYIKDREDEEINMQYYTALLESSVVSKSDTEGRITYINDNFTKVTGYTKSECYGESHNILRHPKNTDEVYRDMWHTITAGDIWRERVLNKNKDGSDFWAETTIIPYKDKMGKIVEYIAIRRDITAMLKMKRKIFKQENEAKAQNKITEAKDSFLVLFTHELKTPLNAIINFSQYLLKHVSKETIDKIPLKKREHLLEQILESAEMMLDDVTNILDISRIKSHKLSYTLNAFDVKELIEDVIKKHSALAAENNVEIIFHDDESQPFITSDRKRYKQILANVLSNAIKYSLGKVEISLENKNDTVSVSIEDNGKGVEGDGKKIFELFEQNGNGLLKKEQKGTGIGLNFVKLLCEDLGFEYKVEDSVKLGGLKFILNKNIRGADK